MTTNKNNTFISILILCTGIFFITIALIYSFRRSASMPKIFVMANESKATKIYNHIKSIDFVNNYPKNDKEVVKLNNDISLLLYGNMLLSSEKISEILTIQRQLFSDSLLEKNDFDTQYKAVLSYFEDLKKDNLHIIDIVIENISYKYDDSNVAIAKVKQYTNKNVNIEQQYELVQNNGDWKINSWGAVR